VCNGRHQGKEDAMGKVLLTMLALAAAPSVMAQQKPGAAITEGREVFVTYCASCHGVSGRGDGPSADEFRRRPADLTQFARRNGGVFNNEAIHRIVDGRTVKAHGTSEMPVWGDAFRWRQGLDEGAIKLRIDAIVRYIESIQERAGH
jgi:mono/diheme cytochrome c family protein